MPSVVAPLVYVDSDVYLDLVTRNSTPNKETGEPRWRSAQVLFDAVNANQVRLASSALVEAEVCCNGESRKDSERIRSLLRGWFTARSTVWSEVDRFLARQAVALLDQHRDKREPGGKKMRTADALHLAAAIRLECDFLMSHDSGFPHGHSISGTSVLRPQVVWHETLWDQHVTA